MLKKRIVFTLLYDAGSFVLSRNFRLQKVGSIEWLHRNYNFSHISFFIDELIVLDVTRGERDLARFSQTLRTLTEGCFVPIAAGGGVRSVHHARELLLSGADKIIINTPLFQDSGLVKELAEAFGQQCVVGSVDVKRESDGTYRIYTESGTQPVMEDASLLIKRLQEEGDIGEIYLNSVDRDGTGQGYDMHLLDLIPDYAPVPIILAGGVGNARHLDEGFQNSKVSAVATAHLFNFVGDGLKRAREFLMNQGGRLAYWPTLSEISFSLKDTILKS
jgi:cyclase